jgi:hypothetical protein
MKVVQSDVITVEYQTITNGGETTMTNEQTQIEVVQQTGLVLVTEPEQVIAQFEKAARALIQVVERTKTYVEIRGRKFLRVEAWTTLGSFFGLSAQVIETKKVSDEPTVYEATAVVVDRNGRVVSRATALCSSAEKAWEGRDEFQVLSMAQTRAVSKAFRLALSAVVVLGGYEPTPAEEIAPEPTTAEPQQPQPEPQRTQEQQTKTAFATDKQIRLINELIDDIKSIGVSDETALETLRVEAIDMTTEEASRTIDLLKQVRDALRAWKQAETPTQRAEHAKRIKELRQRLEQMLQARQQGA